MWFLIYYKQKLIEYELNVEDKSELLKERSYKDSKDVLPYNNDILIEFCNCLFSIITIIIKYDNVDVDRTTTVPLEHCFGRSRVRCKDIHTMLKFLKVISEMNQDALKRESAEQEKIKGRSLGFGVIVEDKDASECCFSSTPQVVAIQFLEFIDIDNLNQNPDESYDDLFEFVIQLHDFVDTIEKKSFSINSITLGTQQAKTIRQRASFSIFTKESSFLNWLKSGFSDKYLKKIFFSEFYQKVIEKNPDFPKIEEKKPKKKDIIDHLDQNFDKYQDDYFEALKFFKTE